MRSFAFLKGIFGGETETKSVSLTDPLAYEIFGAPVTTTGQSVSAATAMRVPAVMHAVRLISETIGSLPTKLYRETDASKEAAKDHPAYRLVHGRANGWTSAGQLRIYLTTDALLHGAGYAQVVRVGDGRPYELHRLDPSNVQRQFLDTGEPFYVVQTANGPQHLSYRDVLYLPAFGETSPITLGREAIGVAMVLERHAAQFFGSGTRPAGIISNEKPAGNETGAKTVANILKSWRTWQANASGDPLILDAGWKFEQPAMTSTDAQFIEHRLEQINEIARIFGVPPHMLYQLDRATWSNAEEMARSFLQLCLRPWLDRWQDAYATVLLTEDEQASFYPEFVIDDLQRADTAGRTDALTKLIAARVMSPNEARATMNMPARDDGDELANPYTSTGKPVPKNDNSNPGEEAA